MRGMRVLLTCLWVGALLAGCGSDGMDDLRTFVTTVHADKKPKVDPLPEIKIQETFAYAAAELPDPFAPQNLRPPVRAGGGPQPDRNRRKEPLEDYPLDSLKMVGTLKRQERTWVVIQAPDGTVHRASVGQYLGQNYGRILRITEEQVQLRELVQGSLGNWVEREATVALSEQ